MSKFTDILAKKNGAKQAGSGLNFFKFEKTDKPYVLRSLPLKHSGLFLDVRHYRGINKVNADGTTSYTTVICSSKTISHETKKCPFCELATKYWRQFDKGGRVDAALGKAAKDLFVKTEYVLAVVDTRAIDPENPKAEDIKLFSARSKMSMELFDNRMSKEQNLCDFSSGRDIMATKKSGGSDTGTIVLDIDDAEPAFGGNRKLFDALTEMVPDLSEFFTGSAELTQKSFEEYMQGMDHAATSVPATMPRHVDVDDNIDFPASKTSAKPVTKANVAAPAMDNSNLDDLRLALED